MWYSSIVVDLEKKRTETEAFLKEFKRHWDKRVLGDREKNDEALATLCIKPSHRAEEIRALKYHDYVAGPEPDRDRPNQTVWKFGKMVKRVKVYIKIATSVNASGKRYWKCLSFHEAEHPLIFPFKRGMK